MFVLSPGISPELAEAFVVVVPIATGIAYALRPRYGPEVALAACAVALGAIKLATDLSDAYDVPVALAAVVGGTVFALARLLPAAIVRAPWRRTALVVLGLFCALVGGLKLFDFYDPFDVLLGDVAIVAGVALVYDAVHTFRGRRATSAPSEQGSAGADRAG